MLSMVQDVPWLNWGENKKPRGGILREGEGKKGEEEGERVVSQLLGGWTPLLPVTLHYRKYLYKL